MHDFRKAQGPSGMLGNYKTRWLQWEKHEEGWWKINMDGCINRGENTAGGGGVIQDVRGTWVTGFTMKLEHATVEEA